MDPSNDLIKSNFSMPMLTEENYPRWRQLFVANLTLRGWEKTLKREVLPAEQQAAGRTAEQIAVEAAAAAVNSTATEEVHKRGLAMMMLCVDPMWFSMLSSAKKVWEAMDILDEQHKGAGGSNKDGQQGTLF